MYIVKSQILISCTWNSNPFLLAYEGINGNCIKGAIDERTKGSHYTIPIEIKHNVKQYYYCMVFMHNGNGCMCIEIYHLLKALYYGTHD